MQQIAVNGFAKGRNGDTDPNKLSNEQYVSAYNVELVGEGAYQSIRNIRGTTEVTTVTSTISSDVLKEIRSKYLINGTQYEGLTIFTAEFDDPDYVLHIRAYVNGTLYDLYEENMGPDYLSNDRIVDAENYPENGVDVIYFTDFFQRLRSFKCEIPNLYSANFLTGYGLSLLRKGANGTITSSTASGGSLLSGTYQVTYRMADPTNKKFTKWSSLTNPIHVYDKVNSTTPVNSGVGIFTDRKIQLTITPSEDETNNFDYLQIAVVENIGPTPPTSASLLDIESIPGTSLTLDYKSNSRIGTIPLEDIVVDLAPIETVKTLKVKENRLFLGNIHYTDLEFDNGEPTVTSGSILRQADSTVDSFSSDDFASKYVGHWRGEVYRYGALYRDEDGNAAAVKPLDLSGVTGNAISGGLTDMKFPDRSSSNSYTIFNNSGRIQSLGLRITGLTNHPSWARSVEIVRLPRKKNILFQSPMIPTMTVQGIGAQSDYPITSYNGNSDITNSDAQPQTTNTVVIPKNLFIPERRTISGQPQSAGTVEEFHAVGEAYYVRENTHTYGCVFPPDSMFSTTPFVPTGGEKLDYVDYALLKLSVSDSSDAPSVASDDGDFLKTNISGNFYAVADNQYFFDSSWGGGKVIQSYQLDVPVTDYAFFDNYGQPTSLAGQSIMDYQSLQTTGVGFWQTAPNIQKMAVVKLGGVQQNDLSNLSLTFSAATLNAVGNGNFIADSSGPTYHTSNSLKNSYITSDGAFVADSSYVGALPIVNVKLGLGDDRYGEMTDLHEYISTGTKYTFTASEVATLEGGGNVVLGNLDVWGGDCFVGPHLFKVCDSTYSIVNQSKNYTVSAPASTADNVARWGSVYLYDVTGADPVISLPVAVEGSAQYVQVILESEYSEVRQPDSIYYAAGNIPIYNVSSKAGIRTPLTYKFNPNLKQQNSQKIYVPKPQFSFQQDDFGARILYSDLKLYNSSEAGFDIFRIANQEDLEEKYGNITKLAVEGDNLYAIQERGVYYIPTGERQVETTDAGTLSIRSGEVIGRPILIDGLRGSGHLRGIVETGSVIYIPDNRNKNVYGLVNQQLKSILQDNETEFKTFFASDIAERILVGIYDPIRLEYWLANKITTGTQIFNERIGWIGANEYPRLWGGTYFNGNMYILNQDSVEGVRLWTCYTGDANDLCGETVVPRLTASVNAYPNYTKAFLNLMANASERLFSIDFAVPNESERGSQTSTVDADIPNRFNTYRFPIPFDGFNARLVGTHMLTTIKWKDVQSTLREIQTKIDLRARQPW